MCQKIILKRIKLLKQSLSILWNSDISTLTYKLLMTGLCVAYELSNFMYLFLWLAAEGSKCTRGHILLLLIAFRLNEKEFLAYCPLFMKWKEITSCIISVYIIRFILFLTFLSWVSPSCSRCREWVLLLYFVTDRCEVEEGVWEVEGEGLRKKPPPKWGSSSSSSEYSLVSVFPELCSATKPRLQVQYSLISLWA